MKEDNEVRRKKILEAIEKEKNPMASRRKKDNLLEPFVNEIKLMNKEKLNINAQLRVLKAGGIKISYKTYRQFLDRLKAPPELSAATAPASKSASAPSIAVHIKQAAPLKAAPKPPEPDAPKIKFLFCANDKGKVKTYAVKDNFLKPLGFTWNKKQGSWVKEVTLAESEDLKKQFKDKQAGYDIKPL